MIHENAAKWDKEHGWKQMPGDTDTESGIQRGFVPHGRPCDRCGKPVKSGYIHSEKTGETPCLEEESKFWLDILY